MAISKTIFCQSCKQTRNIICMPDDYFITDCHECSAAKEKLAREKHLTELQALTIEERIAKIEAWIYDFKFPVDIYNIRF